MRLQIISSDSGDFEIQLLVIFAEISQTHLVHQLSLLRFPKMRYSIQKHAGSSGGSNTTFIQRIAIARTERYCVVCAVTCWLLVPLLLCGCTKEEMNKVVDNVKAKTSSVVQETVAKVIPMGSVKISLDENVEIPRCTVRLLTVGTGRSLLQIRTYSETGKDGPQSVFFSGSTSANGLKALVGQTVSGQLFVQTNADQGIWQSDPQSPFKIKILSIKENEMFGEFMQSQMVRADGKSAIPNGSFQAVMEE
jgi:hypothetical protein